jgi:AcrR family transcriptional regulator
MAPNGPARGPRILRNQPPMDAEQIVAAAVRLTGLYGLDRWTIRQLGEELECWPSVIYHHVGDRDAVAAEVADQVVGMVRPLDESIPWRLAFEQMLNHLRVTLRMHTGVARWLIVNGPVTPESMRGLDRGVRILAGMGLGDEAARAYTVLMSSALLLIAHEEDQAVRSSWADVREVLSEYRGSSKYPGLAAMSSLTDSWDCDEIYRYAVARLLDGVAARLAERQY